MGEGGFLSWVVSFRRALHQSKESEFESLLSLLSNVFICIKECDFHIWKFCPTEDFSSKSFAKELEVVLGARVTSSLVWMGVASPRIKAFC